MRSLARLIVPFVMVAAACGGDSKLPTTPSVIIPVADASLAAVREPSNSAELELSAANIAASLAAEINSSFLGAMEEGAASTSNRSSPGNIIQKLLRDAFEAVVGARVSAQAGVMRGCSRGGNAHVRYSGGWSSGRATLSNTSVVFSGCAFRWGGRNVRFGGNLTANGVFRAGRPAESDVKLKGEAEVEGLPGPIQIDGTAGVYLTGTINGIHVGAPDTLPPPNPTDPTGTLIYVAGTWAIDGKATWTLRQNGNRISGEFEFPDMRATGAVKIIENGITGLVTGSEIEIEAVLDVRIGDPAGYMEMLITQSATMRLNGSTLSGRIVSRLTAACTGRMVDGCFPPTEDDSTISMNRSTVPAPPPTTLVNLSGSWLYGDQTFELQQDGSGNITGRVTGAGVVEGDVRGMNVNNQVTLTSHVKVASPTEILTFYQTWNGQYTLSVYDVNFMAGLAIVNYAESCTGRGCSGNDKTELQNFHATFRR